MRLRSPSTSSKFRVPDTLACHRAARGSVESNHGGARVIAERKRDTQREKERKRKREREERERETQVGRTRKKERERKKERGTLELRP